MQNPLEITFHDIPHSKNIEEIIIQKLDKIKKMNGTVLKCHVVLEKLSQHHQKGNAYCVRLDLKIDSFSDIVVTEESKEGELPLAATVRDVMKKGHDLAKQQVSKQREKDLRSDVDVEAKSDLIPEDDDEEFELD